MLFKVARQTIYVNSANITHLVYDAAYREYGIHLVSGQYIPVFKEDLDKIVELWEK